VLGNRLHQPMLDELSKAELPNWSRAYISAVSVRATRASCPAPT
jgi:hypothetical protein